MILVYIGGLLALVGWSVFVDHRYGPAARAWLVRHSRGRVFRAVLLTTALYGALLVLVFALLTWVGVLVDGGAGVVEYVGYVLGLVVLMPPFAAAIAGRSRPFLPIPARLREERVPLALARAIGWPASLLGTVGFIILAVSPLPLLNF